MAVNERFYGDSTLWPISYMANNDYDSDFPDEEKIKLANFIGEPISPGADYTHGTSLGSAIYRWKELSGPQIDYMFDKSVSFTGLGGDSPYCHLTYIGNISDSDQSPTKLTIMGYDDFNTLSFCWMRTNTSNYGNNTGYWRLQKGAGGNTDGNTCTFYKIRWYPKAIDLGSRLGDWPYYELNDCNRNKQVFITQLPIKRIVWVPYIIAVDANGQNPVIDDLQTYLVTHYESRPHIIGITMKAFCQRTTDLENPTRLGDIDFSVVPLEFLSGLNGRWVNQPNAIDINEKIEDGLFVPMWLNLNNSGIPLGGWLNTGDALSTLGSHGESSTYYEVKVLLDCNVLKWNHWSGNGEAEAGNYPYCYAHEYTAVEIAEAVRRAVACFGMFFCDSATYAQTAKLDAERMCLGTLVNGVGYGDYTYGQDNRDQDQWNWTNMSDSPYDPKSSSEFIPDPNSYLDGMKFHPLQNMVNATDRYLLGGPQVIQLFASLWTIWDTFDDPDLTSVQLDLGTKKAFLTNNPMDCIVGLKLYPIPMGRMTDIYLPTNHAVKVGAVTLYQVGSQQTEIQGRLPYNSIQFDCGTVYCSPQYQEYAGLSDSWIDQYVSFELYLPFCGSVKLDTATYIGKHVGVTYDIDLITGACCAAIYVANDNNSRVVEFMEIRSGNCAVDIPLSGIQQATLEGNMFNATQQIKSAALKGFTQTIGNTLKTVGDAMNGNALGAVGSGINAVGGLASGIMDYQSAKYNLEHTQLPTRMIGAASALNNAECELTPTLIVTCPVVKDFDNYGSTMGYACLKYGKLSDNASGYTEAINVNTSGINCTETEKEMIRSLLASGVYV